MNELIPVLLTIGAALVVACGMFAMAMLFGPKKPAQAKLEPFECGMPQATDPRGRFSVKFYLIALLFVMFDVEIIFLYPWAVSFKKLGLAGFIEMTIFLSIMLLGLLYAIKKGAMEWD